MDLSGEAVRRQPFGHGVGVEKGAVDLLGLGAKDSVKADVWNDIVPLPGMGGYGTVPRAIRTPFLDAWQGRREEARHEAPRLQGEIMAAIQGGRFYELVPFAGQSAGAIHEILPAAEIVRRLVAEAEQALGQAAGLVR